MPMHRQNSEIGTKEFCYRTVTKEIDITDVGDDMEAELSMYGLLVTRITGLIWEGVIEWKEKGDGLASTGGHGVLGVPKQIK